MIRKGLFLLIGTLMLALFGTSAVAANATLPASSWYAVAWVQATDTLHWINPSGEQASVPRPTMINEAGDLTQKRLFISPNGRYLVTVSPLNSGNLGLGFYDFSTGQFVQTHEALPNESLSLVPSADFTMTSSHFSLVLRNDLSGDWRILVFETATGSAIAQLTRTDPVLPQNFMTDTAWWPAIAAFNIDEGMGTYVIQLQLVTDPLAMVTAFPSFRWYPDPPPAVANAPVVADALPFSPIAGFDVFKTTGQVVFTGFDDKNGTPTSPAIGNQIAIQSAPNQLPVPLVANAAFTLNGAQWLHGGQWVGYRVQDGVFQPHFSVASVDGSMDVPLGPNIGEIHSTPDGFVGVDATSWQLYHATDLNMDAFSAFFGNVVFQANQPFAVVYTQPEGATFTLTTIVESPLVGDLDLQAPDAASCPGAPATRLTVGETARVTFTDGTPLNIRNAPSGGQVMQIPEGTVATVIDGPSCSNGYQWWNLSLENGTGGWAAEGNTDSYFLEPYNGILPVSPPLLVGPSPTTVPPVNAIVAIPANCELSPPTRLQAGMLAHIVGTDGTLAMYTNATDEVPAHQLAVGTNLTILDGPRCKSGLRVWHVSAIVNGSSVLGWVAEGFGQTYYLMPGMRPINTIIGSGG